MAKKQYLCLKTIQICFILIHISFHTHTNSPALGVPGTDSEPHLCEIMGEVLNKMSVMSVPNAKTILKFYTVSLRAF